MTIAQDVLPEWGHDAVLSTLARADAERLKAFAEPLIADLPQIEVLENRTGLVMLPMRDTAQGTHFHLGEILMSEARITAGTQDGYGMRRGRDLEAVMAMAVIDVAVALGVSTAECLAFLAAEADAQATADHDTLCRVEATRVNMETF
ncbi:MULTISPECIES: phosphonate C-P lyase system protein PhnG [Rhodobacterales]|jgi:alpha-D-ribose 1-methylphosphonate 5-triphosphate synthase subunit PhnG|uniref:Phosphonate metabolism protein PhnG n=1 Tax=Pelagimonas varians TaxID=696760 RepID=A0A238L078_9RHOB|nr:MULTISPECIES: phosphonate C-P lyase system protein PhnG [Rhodobacterales]PYG27337.1 alpha-D-ribose 1-methylphosphonate 5-triphosphate synthase subunit PhnG [Pelagimonas varians]SMX48338.1 Phosphonate metabolism protein PhnG [Pelagimonas varians]